MRQTLEEDRNTQTGSSPVVVASPAAGSSTDYQCEDRSSTPSTIAAARKLIVTSAASHEPQALAALENEVRFAVVKAHGLSQEFEFES